MKLTIRTNPEIIIEIARGTAPANDAALRPLAPTPESEPETRMPPAIAPEAKPGPQEKLERRGKGVRHCKKCARPDIGPITAQRGREPTEARSHRRSNSTRRMDSHRMKSLTVSAFRFLSLTNIGDDKKRTIETASELGKKSWNSRQKNPKAFEHLRAIASKGGKNRWKNR